MKYILSFFLLVPRFLFAQQFTEPSYPKDYFRAPLDIPILLAGNVGEIRPGHFHAGLDMKTNGHIGMPVHAAADGYISRVAVSSTGYGNVIYITHPAGYTTLYGHLHRFNPQLEKYVEEKQYQQESWSVDLRIPPGLFPVKKGQFIAWSGSTGSSEAPHVHFEIRNTETGHALNGLLFGFDIKDNIAPAVYRIAVYDRSKSIYEQAPAIYAVHKVNGEYVPLSPDIVTKAGKVGFGVSALDHENGTSNIYGVYEEILYDNNRPNIGFRLDDIGNDETRYVNAHVDYKTRQEKGFTFQLLFSLPGNDLPVYHDFNGNGAVDLSDGQPHEIKILVKDPYGNTSTVRFHIRRSAAAEAAKEDPCANRMYPGIKDIFENNHVQFYLDEQALYDDICFRYQRIPTQSAGYYSDVYRLHTPAVPLHDYFHLFIKPDRDIPNNLHDKLVIVRTAPGGGGRSAAPATWSDGWLEGDFRDFGDFSIQADDKAPVITPVGLHAGIDLSKATTMSFRLSDNLSGIKDYRAELDGKWLMFAQKGNTIYYTFDDHCPRGQHKLSLTIHDAAGNQATYLLNFKR